jgi:hypothetical protein
MLADLTNMGRRQRPSPTNTSVSSDDSDESESDLESCFDIGDEAGSSDSALTDYRSDVDTFEEADGLILDEDEDKDHPPEYYLNQEDEFDESEYMAEDYSDGSCLLLDYIEERFIQQVPCHCFVLVFELTSS